MVVDQFLAHPVAGEGSVHYGSLSQNKIFVCMLRNSSLILDSFILSEVKYFSKLKRL
jgi:hypothetical protein